MKAIRSALELHFVGRTIPSDAGKLADEIVKVVESVTKGETWMTNERAIELGDFKLNDSMTEHDKGIVHVVLEQAALAGFRLTREFDPLYSARYQIGKLRDTLDMTNRLLDKHSKRTERTAPVLKLIMELLDSGASFYPSAIENGGSHGLDLSVWHDKIIKALEGMS